MFEKMVKPILLYNCEVWGSESVDLCEKLYLKFCKYILGVKSSTPTNMVRGELGIYPLIIDIKCRILSYWFKLGEGHDNKLSKKINNVLYVYLVNNVYRSPWLAHVKNILDDCGLSYIWNNYFILNTYSRENIVSKVKSCLRDQYIQSWYSSLDNDKCVLYKVIKTNYGLENYFLTLPKIYCQTLCKFRTSNHKLAIEKGRYINIPRNLRLCQLCKEGKIGDEFHVILECSKFNNIRHKYIANYFLRKPSMYKFLDLLCLNQSKKKNYLFIKFIIEITKAC